MSSYNPRLAAIHEAAHAVTARVLGSRIVEITMMAVKHEPPHGQNAIDAAAIAAAGPIATADHGGPMEWEGTQDKANFNAAIAAAGTWYAEDGEEAMLKAARLTVENRDWICTVARRLEASGRLAGDELDALLRQRPKAPAVAKAATGAAAIMRRPRPFIAADLAPIMRRPRVSPQW